MKKTVKRITEQDLRNIISECITSMVNEAESYGWSVDESEVDEAYRLAIDVGGMTEEELNSDIVGCMSLTEKAHCLAFLFRHWDFREWPEYQENKRNI